MSKSVSDGIEEELKAFFSEDYDHGYDDYERFARMATVYELHRIAEQLEEIAVHGVYNYPCN